MRDASGQAPKLCPEEDLVGQSFLNPSGGWKSLPLPFVAPPWYPLRCGFKSVEGSSSNSCPGSEPECRPHPNPHPTTWGNFLTSTSQASLPCSDDFLEQCIFFFSLFLPLLGPPSRQLGFPRPGV